MHWETEGTAEATVIKIFNHFHTHVSYSFVFTCFLYCFILSGCDVLGLGFLSSLPLQPTWPVCYTQGFMYMYIVL